MPKSAPGSRHSTVPGPPRRSAGFTLIELLIVVALIALSSGLVALALRDPAANQLETEAARLAALLESARAEARASGLAARWVPGRGPDAEAGAADFRFVGLPAKLALPERWLDPEVTAEVVGARAVTLGPEPLIGAQRVVLRLADRRIELVTDGLGPFSVAPEAAPDAGVQP
jgi:general secretion pathway protein H